MIDNNTKIVDRFSRPLRDLRISVSDQCNLRCKYCMPADIFGPDYAFLPQENMLSFTEIRRIVKVFASLGVEKIRLTGGEPLIRKNLPSLIALLHQVEGVKDLAMTTNGILLAKFAKRLKDAGLQRINVSLDSLQDSIFQKMSGKGFPVETVLKGIDVAASVGLDVKINMVVQAGVNDEEILPMAKYFLEKGHTLRFIEYMDVGNSNDWKVQEVYPSLEIFKQINQEMPLEPVASSYIGEVAKRYRYKGTKTEIGFISSVTHAFCSTCNRARLSADGSLYTCLFASAGKNLREKLREKQWSDEQLREYITNVWNKRDDQYSKDRLRPGRANYSSKIEMSYIGG